LKSVSATTPPPTISVSNHRRRVAGNAVRAGLPARRVRVRDWRVRTKLGAVLTIPAVAFIVVAGLQTSASVRQATALQQFSRQVALSRQVTALVHELQRERDHTAGIMAAVGMGPSSSVTNAAHFGPQLAPDQQAVDRAADELRAAAAPLLGDPAVHGLYDTALRRLQELREVRAGVAGGWLRQQAVFSAYSNGIASLLALLPSPSGASGDAELAQTVRAVTALTRSKELNAEIRGLLYAVCTAGQFAPQEFDELADARAQRQAALDQFRSLASPQQLAHYDNVVRGQAVRNATRQEDAALEHANSESLGIDAQQWWQAATTQLELMRTVERELLDEAVNLATRLSAAQWRSTLLATSVVILILMVASLTSWAIGRSMARSLRVLREEALDVAQHRLPEAIDRLRTTPRGDPVIDVGPAAVRSADEIGEVAEAFTAVHRSAVRLALEQAKMRHAVNAMFVNLARRSQSLVERQLQLLDSLEAAETDPDQLANLFRLDHLATRMRRNDENLLVLAGSDASRRWPEPVALSSVVLAAMAEIEQYPRIRHDVADDIYVVGHAVADVVHLLAELLENATTFSPPDTLVSVTGWRSTDDSGATVMIQDNGLGMTAGGVADANHRLATPMAIDVAASERMGLVVVGHLAARHRIRVELRGSTEGVLAQVWLPRQLLATPPVHRAAILSGRSSGATEQTPTGRLSSVIRRPIASLAATPAAVAPVAASLADAPAVEFDIARTAGPGVPVAGAGTAAGAAPAGPLAVALTGAGGPGTSAGGAPTTGTGVSDAATPTTPAASGPGAASSTANGLAANSPNPDAANPDSATPDSATPDSANPDGTLPDGPAAGRVAEAPVGSTPPDDEPASSPPPSPTPGSAPSPAPSAAGPPVPAAGPRTGNGISLPRDRGDTRAGADGRAAGPGRGAAMPRRTTPTRAEDVLGSAARGDGGGTRWWSRSGPPVSADRRPSMGTPATPRPPVSGGTSDAGLPIRVPMAQLPGDTAQTVRLGDEPARPIHEPDPSQVGSMLSRFYSGVHRATAEDERGDT
jgi:nitrate/nitrite sensing protein/histidine kinase/DNA gyrase B/HSP90-like ATPase